MSQKIHESFWGMSRATHAHLITYFSPFKIDPDIWQKCNPCAIPNLQLKVYWENEALLFLDLSFKSKMGFGLRLGLQRCDAWQVVVSRRILTMRFKPWLLLVMVNCSSEGCLSSEVSFYSRVVSSELGQLRIGTEAFRHSSANTL